MNKGTKKKAGGNSPVVLLNEDCSKLDWYNLPLTLQECKDQIARKYDYEIWDMLHPKKLVI